MAAMLSAVDEAVQRNLTNSQAGDPGWRSHIAMQIATLKQDIIEDIQEAGWTVKKARENDRISDRDLRHIFDKVDVNRDTYVNRMVSRVVVV